MLLEDLRLIHEDNERLEQAIADRLLDEPKAIRDRLERDHQIATFLDRIYTQSTRAKQIYQDSTKERLQEIATISTGDAFAEFNTRLNDVKSFHRKYPNGPVENLERAYKRRAVGEDAPVSVEVDNMFTGEEAYGRYFDLQASHEKFINLPGMKRRPNYLQYLDTFDTFEGYPRPEKMKEQYFHYVAGLAGYLEGFMKRIKPLENLERIFMSFTSEFDDAWGKGQVAGWKIGSENETKSSSNVPMTEGNGDGIWCKDCEKEFKNDSVYKAHLTGKKHIRAAEIRKNREEESRKDTEGENNISNGINGTTMKKPGLQRVKEKAIAEKEYRVKKLAAAMSTERADTKVNVERKQGMTEKERAQELEALYSEEIARAAGQGGADADEDDDDQKKSNPLHLPLAWDGKPIPFWLYKLHGLGVEFTCEICGNYVYMGRRAFDKHFSEARHLYGLKCLGIINSTMFREITGIEEAKALWNKVQGDKKTEASQSDNVVQMEDMQGNVMPEKVYKDLLAAGMIYS